MPEISENMVLLGKVWLSDTNIKVPIGKILLRLSYQLRLLPL